ncbi:hypothetical protein JTB14_005673 [Gonioctena quinquepunctata]|nr:hypothetical protein JTB14_005673 [Gonioctena quinquepunctata]
MRKVCLPHKEVQIRFYKIRIWANPLLTKRRRKTLVERLQSKGKVRVRRKGLRIGCPEFVRTTEVGIGSHNIISEIEMEIQGNHQHRRQRNRRFQKRREVLLMFLNFQ